MKQIHIYPHWLFCPSQLTSPAKQMTKKLFIQYQLPFIFSRKQKLSYEMKTETNKHNNNKSEDPNRISMERERTCFWFIVCWWGLAICTAVVPHTWASWASHISHFGTNIGMCVLMDADRLLVHMHTCVYTYMPPPLYNPTMEVYWTHLCRHFWLGDISQFDKDSSSLLSHVHPHLSSVPTWGHPYFFTETIAYWKCVHFCSTC